MKFTLLILAGLSIVGFGLLGGRFYRHAIKPLPGAAVRLGKVWGKATDRYHTLRALNTFFYITGIFITLLGIFLLVTNQKPTLVDRTPPNPPDSVLSPIEVLRLVNHERKVRKLPELKEDTRLTLVAQQRADDMAARQYYAHLSPDGAYYYDLFPAQNIKVGYSCENLDIQFTVDESVYVQDWIESKDHRDCLLNKDVTSAGYAVVRFSNPTEPAIYIVVAVHTTSISKLKPKL